MKTVMERTFEFALLSCIMTCDLHTLKDTMDKIAANNILGGEEISRFFQISVFSVPAAEVEKWVWKLWFIDAWCMVASNPTEISRAQEADFTKKNKGKIKKNNWFEERLRQSLKWGLNLSFYFFPKNQFCLCRKKLITSSSWKAFSLHFIYSESRNLLRS